MADLTPLPFSARFAAASAELGPFCLGIDPTASLLAQWSCGDTVAGLERFCGVFHHPDLERTSIVKPQLAFFERFGADGIRLLIALTDHFRSRGTLVLLDGKRGDIGSTAEAYGQAMLGPSSAFRGDAMTVNAYLGFGALRPLCEHAVRVGAGVFVVVMSSNPEGEALQSAKLNSGLTVAESLSEEITAFNMEAAGSAPLGPIGAVVGATLDGAASVTTRLSRSLLLAPGIGTQGATFEDVRVRFGAAGARVIPSASRSVLAAGPDLHALNAAIVTARDEARIALL